MSKAHPLARTRYLEKSARHDFADQTVVAAIEQAVVEPDAVCVAVHRVERT